MLDKSNLKFILSHGKCSKSFFYLFFNFFSHFLFLLLWHSVNLVTLTDNYIAIALNKIIISWYSIRFPWDRVLMSCNSVIITFDIIVVSENFIEIPNERILHPFDVIFDASKSIMRSFSSVAKAWLEYIISAMNLVGFRCRGQWNHANKERSLEYIHIFHLTFLML